MELKLAKGEIIKNVIFGGDSTLIQTDKNVYVCGRNKSGQLGVGRKDNVFMPTKMELKLAKDEVVKKVIFCGGSTLIQTDKNVYVCGRNKSGQLGVGHKDNVFMPTKMELKLAKGEVVGNIIYYKKGSTFVQTNQRMYVCGDNYFGQLGYRERARNNLDISQLDTSQYNSSEMLFLRSYIRGKCPSYFVHVPRCSKLIKVPVFVKLPFSGKNKKLM
jgi:alpha-tubulin suppressor-like RCC1 family protein